MDNVVKEAEGNTYREGNRIETRITPRSDQTRSSSDGFELVRRKQVKRFCLLGLSNKVNSDTLASIISQKGHNDTAMTVFPCKNNPDKVLIRMNVQDNGKLERLLKPNFWPSYVTCRPWRPRPPRNIPPRMARYSNNGAYLSNINNYTYTYDSDRNQFESLNSCV
ncbi:hypothetical protein ACF0H5_023055 [Mactra antiquata]